MMSREIMAYYISLVPAGVCPGTGFCPLPFPVRGAEVASEVGDESTERSLIGLESVVHPGDLSSKKGLLPSRPQDSSAWLPALESLWWGFQGGNWALSYVGSWVSFCLLVSSSKYKAGNGSSLPGTERRPGSNIRGVGEGNKTLGMASAVGGWRKATRHCHLLVFFPPKLLYHHLDKYANISP